MIPCAGLCYSKATAFFCALLCHAGMDPTGGWVKSPGSVRAESVAARPPQLPDWEEEACCLRQALVSAERAETKAIKPLSPAALRCCSIPCGAAGRAAAGPWAPPAPAPPRRCTHRPAGPPSGARPRLPLPPGRSPQPHSPLPQRRSPGPVPRCPGPTSQRRCRGCPRRARSSRARRRGRAAVGGPGRGLRGARAG